MKKIILIMVLLVGVLSFSEKLTTDGNSNLHKLKGFWQSAGIHIVQKGEEWFVVPDTPFEHLSSKVYRYKPGTFYYLSGGGRHYFAWDTKYKTLVRIDDKLNIIIIDSREVDCSNVACS